MSNYTAWDCILQSVPIAIPKLSEMLTITVPSEDAIAPELCQLLEKIANTAIGERQIFRIGISKGFMKYLVSGLPNITTQWSKWQFFLCEECHVHKSDTDHSIYGAWKTQLLPKIPGLKKSQMVHAQTKMDLTECARDYQKKLLQAFGISGSSSVIPQFDVLLLRTGPSGQVCGLYPCHRLVMEKKVLIAPLPDPALPPRRPYITMTFPIINMARCCIFAVTGQGMRKVRLSKIELPLGRVDTPSMYWICDEKYDDLHPIVTNPEPYDFSDSSSSAGYGHLFNKGTE